MREQTANRNRRASGRIDLWVILGIAVVLIVAVILVLLRLLQQSEEHVEKVKETKVGFSDSTWNPEFQDCEDSIAREVKANPDRRDAVFEQLNLSEKGLQQISHLKKLRNVNFTGSTLKDDWLKHLEKLPLKKLNLTATDITNKGLERVARISSLEELCLEDIDSTDDSSMIILKPLKQLKLIKFKGRHVTANGIKTLSTFPLLSELTINSCDATEEFLEAMSELNAVKNLRLESSNIVLKGIPRLRKMNSLRRLYLDGSAIDDERAAALAQLNIQVLSLTNAPLTDIGLAELEKSKSLVHLSVNECRNITDKAVAHFIRAKPDRHITHEFRKHDFAN